MTKAFSVTLSLDFKATMSDEEFKRKRLDGSVRLKVRQFRFGAGFGFFIFLCGEAEPWTASRSISEDSCGKKTQ